jgi:hypothetical protein
MKERTRFIKTVIFNSVNDVDKIEGRVNNTVELIRMAGGNIVSIVPNSYGFSPANLIYNIIYESDKVLENLDVET